MILGPAPAVSEPTAKPGGKRVERMTVVKTDSRTRSVQPEPRVSAAKAAKSASALSEPAIGATVAEPKEAVKETPPPARPSDAASPGRPAPQPEIDLGLPTLSMAASGKFWTRIPITAKIGAVAGVLVLAGVIALTMRTGNHSVASSSGPSVTEAGPPLPVTETGWISDWGSQAGGRRERQILVLRPSVNLSNYRMEFQGQIESKALGWIFRAKDPKNFYVMKLEILKPGFNPTVALVRFAVINGEEQQRSEVPLPMPVRSDTLYKIRFEAVGNHFTTWIQDRKIDELTDDRITSGGVGLYNERGEIASLKGGVSVVPLAVRK
jgi:hypothetical protein